MNVNSDRTSITVSWQTPATDGGQPLLDYTVYFKIVGSPSYSVLIDGLTANTYQATIAKNGLVLSKQYEFIVKARNSVGLSPASNVLQVYLAVTPEPATSVVIAYSANKQNIEVTWNKPTSSGDSPLTRYYIMIRSQQDQSVFTEEITGCDGTLAAVVSSATCSIPKANLALAPHNLAWGG